VPDKKKFLLRIDPELYDALERWANDEFRSINAQIEYLLRQITRDAKRIKPSSTEGTAGSTTHNTTTPEE
jgi:hypothetical protein